MTFRFISLYYLPVFCFLPASDVLYCVTGDSSVRTVRMHVQLVHFSHFC